ncbi:MAG: helix-turn-helix transcriptional regulator [Rhizobiaceae bacterium]|nr:helix-turn-helix transcriptional regulator [Rhizobiaceae bacterium]
MPNTATIYDGIPDDDTIGGRLYRARAASGLSVRTTAWRLGVKISSIEAWERDRSQPSAARFSMLAGMFNVSLSWLLHGIGNGPREEFDDDEAAARLDRLKLLHVESGALIHRLEAELDRRRPASGDGR